jgi:site-specific recombinase XerD
MAIRALIPNRPELALLRGKREPQHLEAWVTHFGKGDPQRARRYAQAVASFLSKEVGESYLGKLSPNTKSSYSFAITEFFEWIAAERGRVVPPEDVTRQDSENYANWLANKPFGLAREKLFDGDRELDVNLFNAVLKGHSKLSDIAKHCKISTIEKDQWKSLHKRLGILVTQEILKRTPTMEELRKSHPGAGINLWEIDGVRLEEYFQYSIGQPDPNRRTTVAQRISALSAFWEALRQGENFEGGEPILKYNVWTDIKSRIHRGIQQEKKQASKEQRMPKELVLAMLKMKPIDLIDVRDRAILFTFAFMGLRLTELISIRRSPPSRGERWTNYLVMNGNTPSVHLIRKGGKSMLLPYAKPAWDALVLYQNEIKKLATSKAVVKFGQSAPSERGDKRFFAMLLGPNAFLFTPLNLWGANGKQDTPLPLTRQGVTAALKRVARKVGLSEEEVDLVHPHAFRHFTAEAMVRGGKAIREVQHYLGHESITTTEGYLEDLDMEEVDPSESILSWIKDQEPPTIVEGPTSIEKIPYQDVLDTTGLDTTDRPRVEASAEARVEARVEAPQFPFTPALESYEPSQRPKQEPQVEGPPVPLDAAPRIVKEEAQDAIKAMEQGKSLGSPDWVYAGFHPNAAKREEVAFSKSTTRVEGIPITQEGEPVRYQQNEFLLKHYNPWPMRFGVGKTSLLPFWQRGGPDKHGYFHSIPPLPVWSPDQAQRGDTETSQKFLEAIERLYDKLFLEVSPTKAFGLARWFGFFVYQSTKLVQWQSSKLLQAQGESLTHDIITDWVPFEEDIDLGLEKIVREHSDVWLLNWLESNSASFKTTMREFRKVSVGNEDDWLASTYDAVELVQEFPEWMVDSDPIAALPESEWTGFLAWLKNVTGRKLTSERKAEKASVQKLSKNKQKAQRGAIEDLLQEIFNMGNDLAKLKDVAGSRESLKVYLATYVYLLSSPEDQAKDSAKGKKDPKFESITAILKFYEELCKARGIAWPYAESWRKAEPRIENRISAILDSLFEEEGDDTEEEEGEPVSEGQLFAALEIDEDARTVYLPEQFQTQFIRRYEQDPELLLRRSLRNLWEGVKSYQAANKKVPSARQQYSTLLSYMAWVVPSAKDMEQQAKESPDIAEAWARKFKEDIDKVDWSTISKEKRRTLRLAWLAGFSEEVADLAVGKFAKRAKVEKEGKQSDLLDKAMGSSVARRAEAGAAAGLEMVSTTMDVDAIIDRVDRSREYVPNGYQVAHGLLLTANGETLTRETRIFSTNRANGKRVPPDGYIPNGSKTLITEGFVQEVLNRFYVPIKYLPSPFRQMVMAATIPVEVSNY